MKFSFSFGYLVFINFVAVLLLASGLKPVECDELSTVFVLETSETPNQDPESRSISNGSTASDTSSEVEKLPDNKNTQIITDESAKLTSVNHHHTSKNQDSTQETYHQSSHQSHHAPSSSSPQNQHSSTANQHHTAPLNNYHEPEQSPSVYSHSSQSKQESQKNAASTARKVEETQQFEPNSRVISHQKHNNSNSSHGQNNPHHRTVQNHHGSQQHNSHNSQPSHGTHKPPANLPRQPINSAKNEERLLISITSNDGSDDDDPKPQKSVVSLSQNGGVTSVSNSGDQDQPSPILISGNSQGQSNHQKRKPSITISIQDPVKQSGGSGPQLILRPSENGQSIVISTVDGGSGISQSPLGGSNTMDPFGGDAQTEKPIQVGGSSKPYKQPVNTPPGISSQQHPSPAPQPQHNHHPAKNQNLPTHHHHGSMATTPQPPPVALVGSSGASGGASGGSEAVFAQPTRRPVTSTLIDVPKPPIQVPTSISEGYQSGGSISLPEESSVSGQSNPKPSGPTNGGSGSGSGSQEDSVEVALGADDVTVSSVVQPTTASSLIPAEHNHHSVNKEAKYPLNERNCGLIHETRIVGGEEANPDDFLWMAAIIKSRPKDTDVRPFCGGSLITRRHVLTAAHCLENLSPRDVLVRLGSYDFEDSASSTSSDYAIDQFRVPPHYSKKSHAGDIAIMRLKTPLALTDNYKTVCMPQARRSYVGALGTVTGYGSQSQTFRRAAPKLRQVTVPVWENRKCSVVYKRPLNESFLCAGYEEGGKDACQGDSGGPLMTEGPNERMMIVGVVSHGIGCGAPGYPGVYTRVTSYLDWIDTNIRE